MPRKKWFGLGNPWNTFLGDCSVVDQYLGDKPISAKWFLAHYLNVFLRAVGQPAFVNNPLSGLVILLGLFLPDWRIGAGCILGGTISTITELILKIHPWSMMRNGVAPVNAVLVGTVFSALFPVVFNRQRTVEMWIFIALGSFCSQFICSAFNNILSKFKVPYMAWPFNVIATASFITLHSFYEADATNPSSGGTSINSQKGNTSNAALYTMNNSTASNLTSSDIGYPAEIIDWWLVSKGIALSMGQVYGINHMAGSMVINLGVFLASPLNFATSTIGACLGTFMGVAFLSSSAAAGIGHMQEVYDGVWGYNSLLAMSSVSCVFFAFSFNSFLLSLVNVAGTGVAQYAMRANMTVENKIPVFTMPKNVVTLTMLAATDVRGRLHRVVDMSYPEKQAYQWYRNGDLVPTQDMEYQEKD